jgi:phosphoketolase
LRKNRHLLAKKTEGIFCDLLRDQGYLLTGRYSLFPRCEAFVTVVDLMLNQYAKWLNNGREFFPDRN